MKPILNITDDHITTIYLVLTNKQIRQDLRQPTYIFTPNKMFYCDGTKISAISITPEKFTHLKTILQITADDYDKGLQALSAAQIQNIITISGHIPAYIDSHTKMLQETLIIYHKDRIELSGSSARYSIDFNITYVDDLFQLSCYLHQCYDLSPYYFKLLDDALDTIEHIYQQEPVHPTASLTATGRNCYLMRELPTATSKYSNSYLIVGETANVYYLTNYSLLLDCQCSIAPQEVLARLDIASLIGCTGKTPQTLINPATLAALLPLPDGVMVGNAPQDGSSLFAALALTLNQLQDTEIFTAKSLRIACYNYYLQHKEQVNRWQEHAITPKDYYFVQYTIPEVPRDCSHRIPIAGRPLIEGRILCQCLEIAGIHLIELTANPEPTVTHFIITTDGIQQIAALPYDRMPATTTLDPGLHPFATCVTTTENPAIFLPLLQHKTCPQLPALFNKRIKLDTTQYTQIDTLIISNGGSTPTKAQLIYALEKALLIAHLALEATTDLSLQLTYNKKVQEYYEKLIRYKDQPASNLVTILCNLYQKYSQQAVTAKEQELLQRKAIESQARIATAPREVLLEPPAPPAAGFFTQPLLRPRKPAPTIKIGGTTMSVYEAAERAFEAKNYVFAFECYSKAAQANDPRALRMLGQYYQFGYPNAQGRTMVPKDLHMARNYYLRAQALGDTVAENNIRYLDEVLRISAAPTPYTM